MALKGERVRYEWSVMCPAQFHICVRSRSHEETLNESSAQRLCFQIVSCYSAHTQYCHHGYGGKPSPSLER